jgi:hypothetical protein
LPSSSVSFVSKRIPAFGSCSPRSRQGSSSDYHQLYHIFQKENIECVLQNPSTRMLCKTSCVSATPECVFRAALRDLASEHRTTCSPAPAKDDEFSEQAFCCRHEFDYPRHCMPVPVYQIVQPSNRLQRSRPGMASMSDDAGSAQGYQQPHQSYRHSSGGVRHCAYKS